MLKFLKKIFSNKTEKSINKIESTINNVQYNIIGNEYDKTLKLTVPESFVYILFANKTLNDVKELFINNIDKTGFEYNDITFRIYKSNVGNYHLEVMAADSLGIYFKPIGYYLQNKMGEITDIYVINEFVKDFKDISYMLENASLMRELKLIDNVFIALASREVYEIVMQLFNSPKYSKNNHLDISKMQYVEAVVNGLNIIVKTSLMGALESMYNDKNNDFNEEHLVIFKDTGNGITLHCVDSEYHNLMKSELLTVFK